uniref:Salivary lipocalin n=1 Tax=Triatoma dimidiata TaxID=72491 RepID=D1MWC0_TRIDM|nr:hypothetical protein Td15 similar to lipocalin-like TiLipo37 [Triatoma dimidiata]
MKSFIVLTFIGILTYAYGNYVTIRECENPEPLDGFSASNFFSGTWYVSHVKSVTSPTVCQTFTTSQEDNKLITEYVFGKGGKDIIVRCEAEKKKNILLTFSCKNSQCRTFLTVFTVMDTNYDNYAEFYKCVIFTSGSKADIYLVIKRESGNEQIPEKAKSLNLQKCTRS